jgi:hypothetical protein
MGHDEDMYRFAEEFIGSVNRVNYNQDNRLNALAGQLQHKRQQRSFSGIRHNIR